jgi:hypothetical protein
LVSILVGFLFSCVRAFHLQLPSGGDRVRSPHSVSRNRTRLGEKKNSFDRRRPVGDQHWGQFLTARTYNRQFYE